MIIVKEYVEDCEKEDLVQDIELIHDINIFDVARCIFYEELGLRDRIIPVRKGSKKYYLRWVPNQVNLVHYADDFWEYNIEDTHIDYELVERGEVYIFFTLEEYTYQIARIIQRVYPKKNIFFLDKKAKLFFSESLYLHIIPSIAEFYNNYKSCISKTILTIDSKKEYIDNNMRFIIKRYRSLSVMTSLFWKRNTISYGNKNPDKTFYVIKDSLGGSGLGDMIRRAFLKVAMVKGKPGNIIPIIDFSVKNDMNQFTEGSGENAWLLYFEQISDVSLSEVYESKNVIVSTHEGWDVFNPYFGEKNCFMDWNFMFRNFLKFNRKTIQYINKLYRETIPCKESRILGVIGRGTDYRSCRSGGTPNPLEAHELLQEAEIAFKQWKCEYIFLATEDKYVYEVFMASNLRSKIIAVEQERIDYENDSNKDLLLYEIKMRDNKNGYFDGLKYLGILYILSKCTCLISSCYCGALQCALGLNNRKYENVKIF